MARLQRFQGASSLPGVGNPGIVADTARGTATAQLGRQIGQSAAAAHNLAERARKREENLQMLEAARREERRLADIRARHAEKRHNDHLVPIALSDEMLDFIETTESSFQEDNSDNQQYGNPRGVFFSKEQLLQDFAADVAAESEAYQLREIAASGEFAVSEIREKPERFDQSLTRLAALVDIAPLPLAQKESAFRNAQESLAEAWLTTRPIEEQIAGLKLIKSRRDAAGNTDDAPKDYFIGRSSDRGRSGNLKAELSSSFEERAQYLPPHKQDRLLAEAIKKKALDGHREEARFSTLITEDPFSVTSQDIRDSKKLEENQRVRLLTGLQDRIAEREKELEAIALISSPGADGTDLSRYGELAELAYKLIDADLLDKDEFIGALVRDRVPLPNSLLSEISSGVRSRDKSEVSASFAKLKAIETLPASFVFRGGTGLATQSAFETWKGLTELKGVPAEVAAGFLLKN